MNYILRFDGDFAGDKEKCEYACFESWGQQPPQDVMFVVENNGQQREYTIKIPCPFQYLNVVAVRDNKGISFVVSLRPQKGKVLLVSTRAPTPEEALNNALQQHRAGS